jgi:hypothetical protein
MKLSSPAFTHGAAIPKQFTCEGENISPELSWTDVPKDAVSFVLVLHDPDAPREGGFTHWIVYNMPSTANHLKENLQKKPSIPGLGLQGKNDSGKIGYMGPCPPAGRHRYFAKLYALNSRLDLEPSAPHQQVTSAMQGKVIAETELMGTYEKVGAKAA